MISFKQYLELPDPTVDEISKSDLFALIDSTGQERFQIDVDLKQMVVIVAIPVQ